MKISRFWAQMMVVFVVLIGGQISATAQAGFDDDRVLLQGFYWESYRHGHAEQFAGFGTKVWYDVVRENVGKIHAARFDVIWLPPPCYAGEYSAGYNPKQYFKLDNSYGSFNKHRALLETLLQQGIEPVADVVINHRDGTNSWADFTSPNWGLWAICRSDEAFYNPNSPILGTPEAQRGQPEESSYPYGSGGKTYAYGDFRDLDHTNRQVRRDILRYMLMLKSAGYRGWRYDMVHGYHARWLSLYNKRTKPTFSVGEYDWEKHAEQRGWVWHTAAVPGDLKTSSDVFDFTTQSSLKENKGNYRNWYGFGNGLGMIGDTTDGIAWKQRSVTFVENHDTGYRTKEDGTPQEGHKFDSFAKGKEVEQAYAYILTHPGVPCVYWKHYFDWEQDLQNKIRALINARKVTGIHAGSALNLQDNARSKGVYAARIEGKRGELYVRIGGSDTDWQPSQSGYQDYREYAQGVDWKVWVKLPGNPAVQQARLPMALPVPQFQAGEQIQIPDDWLD